MKKEKIIELKQEGDVGLRKLRADAGVLYRWGRRRYRARHPKTSRETVYGKVTGHKEHWVKPPEVPEKKKFGKRQYTFDSWYFDHFTAKQARKKLEENEYAIRTAKVKDLYVLYRG